MFKAILKKQFIETFQIFTNGRKAGKPKKGGKALFIGLYVFCFIALLFAFFGVSHMLGDAILPIEGMDWLYYTLLCLMGLAFAVVGSAFSSYTSLYNAKDNELMLSLPIPPIYILFARMIVVFVLGFAFEAVVLIPSMITYWIYMGPSLANVIAPIITMVLLGFIALALSCFLGWLVALVASRVKNKNAATVIFTLLFLTGYYIFYFNIQNLLQKLVENINQYNFPVHIIGSAATGDLLQLIVLIVITAAVFGAVCLILSKSFSKIITKHTAQKKVEYKKTTSLKKTDKSRALLNKEIKRFLGSPVYMLNSGLGIIAMPAGAIVFLIKIKSITPLLQILPNGLVEVLVLTSVLLFASMNAITAPSISLEGQNFWIERSLPLDSFSIINAKIQLHELLTLPPALFMAIVISAGLKLHWSNILPICCAVYVCVIVQAQVGIALNLKMPNMTWTNEAVPVKRSIPAVICLFGGWIISIAIGAVFYLLRNKLDCGMYIIAVMVIGAVISRLLGKWLRTRGTDLLETI